MEKNKIQSFQQKPAIEKLVAGFLFSDKKEGKEMKKTMETPNGQWREVEIDENRETFICIDCEAKTDIKELCRPHEDSLMEYCPRCYYLEDKKEGKEMSKIDYRRSHKGKKYDVRKYFVCETCKELFDVEEACHSVESGYGCFSCFEKIRERRGWKNHH